MAIEPWAAVDSDRSRYDIIPARGQEIHLDRGERFENTLIDLSTGGGFCLRVSGANTVVRNVGFAGLYRGDEFLLSIAAEPGDVLVEDVYLGDGATTAGASSVHGPGAIVMERGNEADVTFRRCNVQGFPNNGYHCSHTGDGSSSVHFDRCFGKNNGVATFRCAGGEDLLERCVAYTDITDYGHEDEPYLETNGRPVWVWNGGPVTIRDSHFGDGPYPHAVVAGANDAPGRIDFESGAYRGTIQRASGSTVDVGPDVTRDPDLSIPDGVPTDAEAAATSAAFRSSSDDAIDPAERLPHVVIFDGTGTAEPTSYSFEAAATVPAVRYDEPVLDGEVVDDEPVLGSVFDTRHAYWFRGPLEALSLRGEATVTVQYDARPQEPGEGSIQS